jgi:hypothetical protein
MNPVASAFPVALLRGKRANGEHCHSLRIEDSPQFTAESFNSSDAELGNLHVLLSFRALRVYSG